MESVNLLLGWLWILLGFGSGLLLGLFFTREHWLGGYAAHKRRLYRLGHISFFGLGAANLCFYFTVQWLGLAGTGLGFASWLLVAGAVTMPLCCAILAHFPRAIMIFSVPVISLLLGGTVLFVGLVRETGRQHGHQQIETSSHP